MELVSLSLIALLGAMSPGPDFAIVTSYALSGSRKKALLASLGISLAILIHIAYTFFGLAYILQESTFLFKLIQVIGAIYLSYIGIKLILSKNQSANIGVESEKKAFITGFLTNILNPKASLFFLSVFSQLFTSNDLFFVYTVVIVIITLSWFSFLSYIITHKSLLPLFMRFQNVISKIMGTALLLLASLILFY